VEVIKVIKAIRYSFVGAEIVYAENSYGFFEIIREVFPDVEPYMDKFGNVVSKVGNAYYNISGEAIGSFEPFSDEDLTAIKKNFNERSYKRTTFNGPAHNGTGRPSERHTTGFVFSGYYYGIQHSPAFENERQRLRSFFGERKRKSKRKANNIK